MKESKRPIHNMNMSFMLMRKMRVAVAWCLFHLGFRIQIGFYRPVYSFSYFLLSDYWKKKYFVPFWKWQERWLNEKE